MINDSTSVKPPSEPTDITFNLADYENDLCSINTTKNTSNLLKANKKHKFSVNGFEMSSSLTTTPTKSPLIARSVENDYQTVLLIPNMSESNSKFSSSLTNDSFLGSSIRSLTTDVSSSLNQNQLSTNGSFSCLNKNTENENSDCDTHSLINFKSNSDNINKPKSKIHPNIHHRPAIYKHHHRPSVSNTNSINNNQLNNNDKRECSSHNNNINPNRLILNDDNSMNRSKENLLLVNGYNNCNGSSSFNTNTVSNTNNNLSSNFNSSEEYIEIENEIKQLQDAIDKLNHEIFKNPNNCTRPPSEYLELFTHMTSELHNLQVKKQQLEANKNSLNTNANQSEKNEKVTNSNQFLDQETNNYINSSLNDHTSSCNFIELNSNNTNENNYNNYHDDISIDNDDPRLIGSPSTDSIKSYDSNSTAINNSENDYCIIPRVKLEHPTSLGTTTNNNKANLKFSYNGNNNPDNDEYIDSIAEETYDSSNIEANIPSYTNSQYNMFSIIESSPAPTPVSINSNNQDILNHNNRSFNDLNEFNNLAANMLPNGYHPTPSTLSPTSSMATTPTYLSNSISGGASYFRIFIGSSTTVVEKKPIPLRDLLLSKLKSRDLDVDKCIAYIKESNYKIDWDVDASTINTDCIVVTELSDELRHNFEKKTFTIRSCSCKKKFLFNVYGCINCDFIMCQRNECRMRSEKVLCIPRRQNLSVPITNSTTLTIRQDSDSNSNRSDSAVRESQINNISQQILPIGHLKVSIPSRDRSRSETELNIFVNSKLTNDTNRVVQKSPTSIPKATNNGLKNIYNTMPRNQYANMIKQANNPDNRMEDISGSISNGSGSVINSLINTNQTSIYKTNNNITKIVKQHVPSRRDSFNSYEIPFKQIAIDKNSKVGSGSFGIVHQGKDFYHGIVAIKFLNVQNPTSDQAKAFRNEVRILKSTRHDNILLFIGCILKPYLAIVTEWCPGSSLYRHIHCEEEHWDMMTIVDITKQIATGMEYLHVQCDILHRDLKSNNIFLIPKETSNLQQRRYTRNNQFDDEPSEKWRVKIGDFGLATVKSKWTQSSKKNQPTGSILWMAPEVITQKVSDPYTQKSDVYSFSVVLYELITGHLPYLKKEQNMILFLVGSGRLKLNPDDSREDTPDELKELLFTCSHYEREKRLDFVQINEQLKKIKLTKTKSKIKRAQSLPNVKLLQESMNSGFHNLGTGVYEDVLMYPTTPQPDSISKQHSPIQA